MGVATGWGGMRAIELIQSVYGKSCKKLGDSGDGCAGYLLARVTVGHGTGNAGFISSFIRQSGRSRPPLALLLLLLLLPLLLPLLLLAAARGVGSAVVPLWL